MDDFFNGKELSFLLLLTLTIYILAWHVPSRAAQIMMTYFIFVFIYTMLKLIFARRFRAFPLIKTFCSILLLLIVSEYLITYKYDEITSLSVDFVLKYFSTLNVDFIRFGVR